MSRSATSVTASHAAGSARPAMVAQAKRKPPPVSNTTPTRGQLNGSHQAPTERVAVHEAAHAVIARVFGVSFRSVTVVPSEGFLGACNFYADDFYCDRKGRVIASMAGRAAELEFFGSTAGDYKIDDASIATVRGWPKIGGVRPKLCEPSLRRQARRLVRRHRAQIERVAQALIERRTMTPDEVDAVMAEDG